MKKERGIALVTVLILVLVFSVVGVGMMILSRRDVGESQRNRKSQMALAAAEAGIDQAIWELEQADTWTGNTSWQSIGTPPDETRFICSVDTEGLPTNQYAIVCTGTAIRVMNVSGGDAYEVSKRLKVLVEITPAEPESLDDVVYSPCQIQANGNPTLDGDVNSGLCGVIGGGANITGTETNYDDWLGIDEATLRALADAQGRHYDGDVTEASGQFVGNNISTGPANDTLPDTFWLQFGDQGFVAGDSTPFVTFIEKNGANQSSLTLSGACGGGGGKGGKGGGTPCGLFGIVVVLGDLVTCPPCPPTIPTNGNITISGSFGDVFAAIYCTGQYRNNGAPFPEGGVIVCGMGRFNGSNSGLSYNAEYANELATYITTTTTAGTEILSYQDISY